jgi:proline dehydrogenase
MIDTLSKASFHALAGSRILKRLASRHGMARPHSFARRFIAGETLEEAIAAARAVEAGGLTLTLDYLGESVATFEAAEAATCAYLRIVDAVVASGITRNISLKPTQLGLDLDHDRCLRNLRRIVEQARAHEFFVRIDMENSPYVEVTLQIFETLWAEGFSNVGVVLQSALHRSEADLRRMNALGARVRLVKGAYKEPPVVAWQLKADVDAAYIRMMAVLLREGRFPALATHDTAIIAAAQTFATTHGIAPDTFEFQMLYGIRRDLQASLTAAGYRMRVYIPFGREWFPYFMRRLGERPANIGFVLRGIFSETVARHSF